MGASYVYAPRVSVRLSVPGTTNGPDLVGLSRSVVLGERLQHRYDAAVLGSRLRVGDVC